MKLIGDFHTHTTYTHGLSTIEENVQQAENLGLQAIAITEHAYKATYPIKQGDLEKMKAEIENLQPKYRTKILLGIETNLISLDGDIDVPDEELSNLDLVVFGFHRFCKVGIKQFFKFVLPNLLFKPNKKKIERNTMAYIRAMDKHRISILAHLNYAGCQVDCLRLAKECATRGIYIELNGKRINFTKQEILDMLSTDVKFIINSDAHDVYSVGKNHRAFNIIEKYGIPLDRVVNLNEIPKFK